MTPETGSNENMLKKGYSSKQINIYAGGNTNTQSNQLIEKNPHKNQKVLGHDAQSHHTSHTGLVNTTTPNIKIDKDNNMKLMHNSAMIVPNKIVRNHSRTQSQLVSNSNSI